MKLKFKRQQFQADAAAAVCDVFAGQPYSDHTYTVDPGVWKSGRFAQTSYVEGFNNRRVELSDAQILDNLQKVQRRNQLQPSDKLEGKYNLTIEMETGVGKTYAYIKTMYELRKRYGWRKFIVVVPSIAIREGVYKSFSTMQDHFAEEYGSKIRVFVYNSARLNEIDRFASDSSINVMIINSQAFNARGENARRIKLKLDEFRSRRPIDVLAATNPIMIIDEPQSVEGKKTKEGLKEFNPLITLRYSATHKKDSIYNMVYRLDAMEAYNKRLVKKIAVKGISESGTTATEGYVYLEGINLSKSYPTATIHFDAKTKNGVRDKRAVVDVGYSLFAHSGELDEYRDGFTVKQIDGRDGSIELVNGQKLYAGDVVGKFNEEQKRRIQIRETILSHIERERKLFRRGIKVLSLFFIDEVAKYRQYANGTQAPGVYARMFEEEYRDVVENFQLEFGDEAYLAYLKRIPVEKTHAGYFSVDKKGNMVDGKTNKEGVSEDVDAYDLIMKNKEALLDPSPERSPVRFIFSHSALREGWDNPNVFQICTLKNAQSDVRKRQEVGRGLRLCVDRNGDRMDSSALGAEVHDVNVLTIIASESYDEFARGLQTELAEAVAYRPRRVTKELFINKELKNEQGTVVKTIDEDLAGAIVLDLYSQGYIDKKYALTDKFFEDVKSNAFVVDEEVQEFAPQIADILRSVYDPRGVEIENARTNNVEVKIVKENWERKAFQELWSRINAKSYYCVDFDSDELIDQAVSKLDDRLFIAAASFSVESGEMDSIESKEALLAGEAFNKGTKRQKTHKQQAVANNNIKFDLVGRIVEETGLTRKATVAILTRISPNTFAYYRRNPEEFIAKASALINEAKATVIVNHIEYNLLDESFGTEIFTEPNLKGKLGVNAKKTPRKHLYDHLLYDSKIESDFADDLEGAEDVAVYVKLPGGFYISTPVGKYNPDWAVSFVEGVVKHVYFVAETKGNLSSLELREIEKTKIECARKHFEKLNSKRVKYGVVDSYKTLLELVKEPAR